jgi:hypothetical protein
MIAGAFASGDPADRLDPGARTRGSLFNANRAFESRCGQAPTGNFR